MSTGKPNLKQKSQAGYWLLEVQVQIKPDAAMAQNHASNKRSERTYEPKVLRSASNSDRFWWVIRSSNGEIIDSSRTTYPTKADALRAANAVARALQRGSRSS